MTYAEIRDLLARCDPRKLRQEAGISAYTVERAFGISRGQLARWERREAMPVSPAGLRWMRLVRVLANHARVTAELAAMERRAA